MKKFHFIHVEEIGLRTLLVLFTY